MQPWVSSAHMLQPAGRIGSSAVLYALRAPAPVNRLDFHVHDSTTCVVLRSFDACMTKSDDVLLYCESVFFYITSAWLTCVLRWVRVDEFYTVVL